MNKAKMRLTINAPIVGGWILSGSPAMAEAMAEIFPFVVIDQEHGAASLRDVENCIRAIECRGSVPFVRIDSPDRIGAYLDAGALGIIAPNIQSAADACEIVARAKYPPGGDRSYSLSRATSYGDNSEVYFAGVNDDIVVVAMVESMKGVANVADIIGVSGIDAVLVGPYDLTGDLGKPGDVTSQAYVRAMDRIAERCREADVPYGVHFPDGTELTIREAVVSGMTFLAVGMDTRAIFTAYGWTMEHNTKRRTV